MTLFSTLSHRVCLAFGLSIASALYFPAVMAAELEGTAVQVDASSPVEVQLKVEVPVAPLPPDVVAPDIAPPPPHTDGHEEWMRNNEAQVREAEARARDVERRVRDHQQNWQRDLEKNLSQAFGGGSKENEDNNDEGASGMDALIVIFIVFAVITMLCSPLILVGFYLALRYRARARRQQELNNNIDKLLAAGRDIPVEILRGDEPKTADDHGNHAKGIRNICLGTGWLVFLTIAVGIEIGAIGFIWVGLGISQVLIWYLNKPRANPAAELHTELQAGQQD